MLHRLQLDDSSQRRECRGARERRIDRVQTVPGRHWFAYFRFYGPLEPYFDRSYTLGDITRVG